MSKNLLIISCVLAAVAAQAQVGTNQEVVSKDQIKIEDIKKTPPKKENVERVEVTGSYIRRIDMEGPSPLVTIDRAEFENSGNLTVEDVLKENAYFEAVYDGHVRFHGQHAGNTLILLNGMRLPKESGGYYTSVSYIPSLAIDRVELLKDGSAALYGSDAMAGVVNFITRKEYDGASFSSKYKISEDGLGQEQNYSASFGKSYRKGSYLLLAQYRKLDPFFESDLGSRSSDPGHTSVKANSGYVAKKGDKRSKVGFGPTCAAGSDCSTDPNVYDQVQEEAEDIGAMATGAYEFTGSTRATMMALYNRKSQIKAGSPLWVEVEVPYGQVKSYSAVKNLPEGMSDNDMVTLGTRSNDLGAYITERVSDTMSTQVQLEQDFAETWNWKWSTGYTFQNVQNRTLQGDASRSSIRSKYLSQQWTPTANGNDLSDAEVYPVRRNEGQMVNTKFVSAGELFDLGEGVVAMAIGGELEHESFDFNNDEIVTSGDTISRKADNYDGFRSVNSVFAEISATPLAALELQVAGRFDSYNDFGSTFNPKFAMAYRPIQSTLLRASYGTGFKPPGVSDMFTPSFVRNDGFNDIIGSNGDYVRRDVNVVRNEEITFETSTHYNFGAVFQPNRVWTFTVDQWNFEGEGTISNFTAENAMDFYRRHGLAGLSQVESMGLKIEVDPSDDSITSIQVPNVFNRAEKILRGVDFSADVNAKGRLFGRPINYGFKDTISHIYERKERTFEFSELEDRDLYGTKNTLAADLGMKNHFYQLSARTQLNGDRTSVKRGWKFPVYTEYDLTYAYSSKDYGKFSLTVKNLVNSDPSVNTKGSDVALGDRSLLYSPLGRRFVLGYSLEI